MSTSPTKTLTVSIACPQQPIYEFVLNPENLPAWATAFVHSVRQDGTGWVVETDEGSLGFRLVPRNELGVLDHAVRLPSGVEVFVPMRVVPNGDGSEVLFTLFQSPEMSDEKFAEDARMVERDLGTLKRVLEGM